MLSFAPLSADEIERHLETLESSPDEARLRARLARGSIGRAIGIDLAQYREMRLMLMGLIETLASSRSSIKLLNVAEYLGRKLEKEGFEEHLDVLMVLLSDLFHLKLRDSSESLTNADIARALERAADALTLDEIAAWTDRIEEVLRALPRNVNRQLAMEAMLLTA